MKATMKVARILASLIFLEPSRGINCISGLLSALSVSVVGLDDSRRGWGRSCLFAFVTVATVLYPFYTSSIRNPIFSCSPLARLFFPICPLSLSLVLAVALPENLSVANTVGSIHPLASMRRACNWLDPSLILQKFGGGRGSRFWVARN